MRQTGKVELWNTTQLRKNIEIVHDGERQGDKFRRYTSWNAKSAREDLKCQTYEEFGKATLCTSYLSNTDGGFRKH